MLKTVYRADLPKLRLRVFQKVLSIFERVRLRIFVWVRDPETDGGDERGRLLRVPLVLLPGERAEMKYKPQNIFFFCTFFLMRRPLRPLAPPPHGLKP